MQIRAAYCWDLVVEPDEELVELDEALPADAEAEVLESRFTLG